MSDKITRQSVYESLRGELKTMKKLAKLEDPSSSDEYREPLSVERYTEVRILLSWGGPEDGFKLKFDSDGQLMGGMYYEANWGEYKEVELTPAEAEEVAGFYGIEL